MPSDIMMNRVLAYDITLSTAVEAVLACVHMSRNFIRNAAGVVNQDSVVMTHLHLLSVTLDPQRDFDILPA